MSITRRVTFRLYPSNAQLKILSYWRRLHKDLYNAAVANRKTQYKHFKKSVDYYEQQNCLPDFKEVWQASFAGEDSPQTWRTNTNN